MIDDINDSGFGFSPFDSPVTDTKKQDIKIEKIEEAEIMGESTSTTQKETPKDAPEFNPPDFDSVDDGGDFADFSDGGGIPGEKGSGGETEEVEVPSGFSKEFTDYSAKWLVDIYFKLFIGGLKAYCKIDKSEIQRGINSGLIHPKFVKYVDDANDKIDNGIDVSEQEKDFIIEPLKFYMESKKIQMKPEYMVLGSFIMVSAGLFMSAMDMRKQNQLIVEQIIMESEKIRSEERAKTQAQEQARMFREQQQRQQQRGNADEPIDIESFTAKNMGEENPNMRVVTPQDNEDDNVQETNNNNIDENGFEFVEPEELNKDEDTFENYDT